MLADELVEAGVPVVEASSADAAILMLEGGLKPGLVVTDVRMPGRLDGLQLAAWLAEWRPGTPVVVTSGYVAEAEARSANPAILRVLTKPYRPSEVVAVVLQGWLRGGS